MTIKIHRWNNDEIEYIRRRVMDAKSARQIAAELSYMLNCVVTRNMVIGICSRNDILMTMSVGGRPKGSTAPRMRPARRVMSRVQENVSVSKPVQLYEHAVELADYNSSTPPGQRKTLIDLERPRYRGALMIESGDCRWPIGDPQHEDFFFCGDHADGNYCPVHRYYSINHAANNTSRVKAARRGRV